MAFNTFGVCEGSGQGGTVMCFRVNSEWRVKEKRALILTFLPYQIIRNQAKKTRTVRAIECRARVSSLEAARQAVCINTCSAVVLKLATG